VERGAWIGAWSVWRPGRAFKENFVAIGFLLVSLFLVSLFVAQCALWLLIPVFLLVIAMKLSLRKK
jgi:diacylglycerol kinase